MFLYSPNLAYCKHHEDYACTCWNIQNIHFKDQPHHAFYSYQDPKNLGIFIISSFEALMKISIPKAYIVN